MGSGLCSVSKDWPTGSRMDVLATSELGWEKMFPYIIFF